MNTPLKPELSRKNRFWIDRERYYELKHFCRQYPTWKQNYNNLDGLSKRPIDPAGYSKSSETSDPTEKCVELKEFYRNRIDMIENTAKLTDPIIAPYILKGVTEGISYECMRARIDIPCCKDKYYELYREFFWLLSRTRK